MHCILFNPKMTTPGWIARIPKTALMMFRTNVSTLLGGEDHFVEKIRVGGHISSPVELAISSINSDPHALEVLGKSLRDCSIRVLFVSSSSIILKAEPDKIIKVYTNIPNARLQSMVEWRAYDAMKNLPIVPKAYAQYSSESLRFIVVEYTGIDAMELLISEGVTIREWNKAILQLSNGLQQMHDINQVHGDIKLENFTFNGSKWFFIDFGLSYIQFRKAGKFSGTFPNILPVYGLKNPHEELQQLGHFDVIQRRKIADIYAFALTMLNFTGFDFTDACVDCREKTPRCSVCQDIKTPSSKLPFIIVSIENFYKFRTSGETTVRCWGEQPVAATAIRLLIDVAFTQLDLTRALLVWDKTTHSCYYSGTNSYHTVNYVPPKDTFDAWFRFLNFVQSNIIENDKK